LNASTVPMYGLRRAALYRDADAGRHDVGTAVGKKLARLDEIIDLEIHQHREIERLARFDPPLHHRGNVGDDDWRIARDLFKLRTKLADDDLGHPRAEDFQFGSTRWRDCCRGQDQQPTYCPPSLHAVHADPQFEPPSWSPQHNGHATGEHPPSCAIR